MSLSSLLPRNGLTLLMLGVLAGCGAAPAPEEPENAQTRTVASPEEGGAVSQAPVTPVVAATVPAPSPRPKAKAPDWSPMELTSGQAWIDCQLDYARGDGEPVTAPSRANLRSLLEPCRDADVLRLRYRGKIASDFTALVERVTRMADGLGIGNRVLDLDSPGGQVEDAIRAGDWIGNNHWVVWVRENSVCHSACVFVLAGGDSRVLVGQVGIHRIIRLSSTATNRDELNTELQAVYATVRAYLERNGASPLLADVMKTVPNLSLRLLTRDELQAYGLDGNNAAEDDLDRVRLLDTCGDDFMHRREAWVRAYGARCRSGKTVQALNDCGLQLRGEFGFPGEQCPAASPLAEFNTLEAQATATDAGPAVTGSDAEPPAAPSPATAAGPALGVAGED